VTDELARLIQRIEERAELPSREELRRLRISAGLSAREVARALGVSPQAVLNWEMGTRRPSPRHLSAYVTLIRALKRVSRDRPRS
jgi:DNA-binding transcriptional regulator YiaG